MSEPEIDVQNLDVAASETSPLYQEQNLPALADVENLRWKVLIGSAGEKIGTIENIDVDEDTGRVEFIEVGRGGFLGFGAERFLVSVTRIVQVEEKTVQIDLPLQRLGDVPPYDFQRLSESEYRDEVRTWWCLAIAEDTESQDDDQEAGGSNE